MLEEYRLQLRSVADGVARAGEDCLWVEATDADHVLEALCREVVAVVRELGLDPHTQMQVLSPMHRGPLGTEAINKRLQVRVSW